MSWKFQLGTLATALTKKKSRHLKIKTNKKNSRMRPLHKVAWKCKHECKIAWAQDWNIWFYLLAVYYAPSKFWTKGDSILVAQSWCLSTSVRGRPAPHLLTVTVLPPLLLRKMKTFDGAATFECYSLRSYSFLPVKPWIILGPSANYTKGLPPCVAHHMSHLKVCTNLPLLRSHWST